MDAGDVTICLGFACTCVQSYKEWESSCDFPLVPILNPSVYTQHTSPYSVLTSRTKYSH